MDRQITEIGYRLREKGLKVTSRRVAIIEAIIRLNNHPSAEEIINEIRKTNPDIAVATVYKALNILAEKQVINKVVTEKDITRFDAIPEPHFHLYCPATNRMEDFSDSELNGFLEMYFEKKKIPGFVIEDFELQIIGRYINKE